MYNNNNHDLISDIKEDWERPNRTDNHLTLAFIIVSLSLSVLGASYYYHLKHMEELLVEAKTRNDAIYFKTEKIAKVEAINKQQNTQSKSKYRKPKSKKNTKTNIYSDNTHPSLKKKSKIQHYNKQHDRARELRQRRDAFKTNLRTCNYWKEKYGNEKSSYNKRMIDDSCGRYSPYDWAIPSTQPKVVINNINNYRNRSSSKSNGCVSLASCTNYKNRLNQILSKMRSGYTALQYNSLEGRRKHWKNKIFDNCKCYKTNSF